jgi:hypothetical protein
LANDWTEDDTRLTDGIDCLTCLVVDVGGLCVDLADALKVVMGGDKCCLTPGFNVDAVSQGKVMGGIETFKVLLGNDWDSLKIASWPT